MKKVLVVIMALAIMVMCSVSVLAAPTNFISSPSENGAPTIVESSNEDEDCTAIIVITPYSQRKNLSSNSKSKMEKAYKNVTETPDVSKLNEDLEKAAKDQGINGEDLAVSDLFDIDYKDCIEHDDHGKFTIKLSAETLKNFVGFMRYDGEKWILIKDATVSNGNYLTFTSEDLGTFAVVVKKDKTSPATGDSIAVEMVVMLASLCAVAFVARKVNAVKAG